MYGWVPLLSTWNYHNLVNQLHSKIKFCCLVAQSCLTLATPWTAAHQAFSSFTIPWSLLKLMYIESGMSSNHLILYHLLFLRPLVFPIIRVYSNELGFHVTGGQSVGPSPSASVLPVDIQGWFPLGLTGLISLQSKELSRVFSNTTVQRHHFFTISLFNCPAFTYIHDYTDLCRQINVSAF